MANFLGFSIKNHQKSVALLHGIRYTIRKSFVVFFTNDHLVDDHFDIVIFVAVELHAMHHLTNLTVNSDIKIAFLADLLE